MQAKAAEDDSRFKIFGPGLGKTGGERVGGVATTGARPESHHSLSAGPTLLIANDATSVVVDPAAPETHLAATRRQRPATDRAALDLSAGGTEAIRGFAARGNANLRGRRACDRNEHAQARNGNRKALHRSFRPQYSCRGSIDSSRVSFRKSQARRAVSLRLVAAHPSLVRSDRLPLSQFNEARRAARRFR